MRVVLDENMPEALTADSVGHDCGHVVALGWAGIMNGALLNIAELAGCQVLITLDQGIPRQQNMAGRRIAVFGLSPQGQGVRAIRALIGDILAALLDVREGEVRVFTNREAL